MAIDPLRLTIALVPLAAYLLLLAVLNARRHPFLTSGGSDLFALGLALSGLVFVGPLELLRPELAAAEFGNYVWLTLLIFYWLWVLLFVLVVRPRVVIFNITADQLRPILGEAAVELDGQARWAGDSLTLPSLGVQLHIDDFPPLRNVSLSSSGSRQSLEGWRRLNGALAHKLRSTRVRPNACSVVLLFLAMLMLGTSLAQLLGHPLELAQAMREVFEY